MTEPTFSQQELRQMRRLLDRQATATTTVPPTPPSHPSAPPSHSFSNATTSNVASNVTTVTTALNAVPGPTAMNAAPTANASTGLMRSGSFFGAYAPDRINTRSGTYRGPLSAQYTRSRGNRNTSKPKTGKTIRFHVFVLPDIVCNFWCGADSEAFLIRHALSMDSGVSTEFAPMWPSIRAVLATFAQGIGLEDGVSDIFDVVKPLYAGSKHTGPCIKLDCKGTVPPANSARDSSESWRGAGRNLFYWSAGSELFKIVVRVKSGFSLLSATLQDFACAGIYEGGDDRKDNDDRIDMTEADAYVSQTTSTATTTTTSHLSTSASNQAELIGGMTPHQLFAFFCQMSSEEKVEFIEASWAELEVFEQSRAESDVKCATCLDVIPIAKLGSMSEALCGNPTHGTCGKYDCVELAKSWRETGSGLCFFCGDLCVDDLAAHNDNDDNQPQQRSDSVVPRDRDEVNRRHRAEQRREEELERSRSRSRSRERN